MYTRYQVLFYFFAPKREHRVGPSPNEPYLLSERYLLNRVVAASQGSQMRAILSDYLPILKDSCEKTKYPDLAAKCARRIILQLFRPSRNGKLTTVVRFIP